MRRIAGDLQDGARVLRGLDELGWQYPPTQANFVWLPLGERTPEFVAAAERQALSVRGFGTEGVRVSIGEVEANTRFLELVRQFPA